MSQNAGTEDRAMFNIPDFCDAHSISRSLLYKLGKQGKGPRICKVGARSLISAEDAAEWRRGLETRAA